MFAVRLLLLRRNVPILGLAVGRPNPALRVHELAYQSYLFVFGPDYVARLRVACLIDYGLVHGRSPRVTLEHKGGLDMSGGLELGNETGIFMYGTTAAF